MGLNTGEWRMRTDSVMSVKDIAAQASTDEITSMLRSLTEKSRQVEDLKRASEAATQDHEEELFRLQERLDDVLQDLSNKRKEERDIRARLKQSTDVIATLEAEVHRQTTKADSLKEAHSAAKKQLEEQRSRSLFSFVDPCCLLTDKALQTQMKWSVQLQVC